MEKANFIVNSHFNFKILKNAQSYMVEDQRYAAQRPDVLTFETDELTTDVTIAGSIQALLKVSTTGTDADWVVKVIDV